jgi:hypothetical protein
VERNVDRHALGRSSFVRAFAAAVAALVGVGHLDAQPSGTAVGTVTNRFRPTVVYELVPVQGTDFFRLRTPDGFLHTETGNVTVGPIDDGWWSAMWEVEKMPTEPFVRLRNRFRQTQLLHTERGAPEAGAIETTWWSAMWTRTNTGAAAAVTCGGSGTADWMCANRQIIGGRPMRQLVIPGTHDAGVYELQSTYERRTNFSDASMVFAPDAEAMKQALSFAEPIMVGWSKAQSRRIYDQLRDGIRYLDLRVCVDGGDGSFRACHGLYGPKFEVILSDVRRFLDEHPGEVVILGFNHFWDGKFQTDAGKKLGEQEGLRAEKWREFGSLVKANLGGKLVGSSFTPSSSLNDLWNGRTAASTNQAIAIIDRGDSPLATDPAFWIQQETGTWVGETVQAVDFKNRTVQAIDAADRNAYGKKFWAVRASLSPAGGDYAVMMASPSPAVPRNLQQLAGYTNPVVLGWIMNEWRNRPINLVWADHYHESQLVCVALERNGISASINRSQLTGGRTWPLWGGAAVTAAATEVERWLNQAGLDMEAWGVQAGNDFVAFWENLFNPRGSAVEPAANGSPPPSPPPNGVRHYRVILQQFQGVKNCGEAGSSMEIFGGIALDVQGASPRLNPGANKYLMNLRRGSYIDVPGGSACDAFGRAVDFNDRFVKDLYFDEKDFANGSPQLKIDIRLREQDDTGADDVLLSSPLIIPFAVPRIGRDEPGAEWFYWQAADAPRDQQVQLRVAVRRLK